MFKMAASCRVKSLAKLAGSLPYSSRARAMQRSIIAALLRSTSSAIDPAIFHNVIDEAGAPLVERGFLAQDEGFVDPSLHIAVPKPNALGYDLILQNGRGGTQIDEIDRAVCHFGEVGGKLPKCDRIERAIVQYGYVEIAFPPRRAICAAAEQIDGEQVREAGAQVSDKRFVIHISTAPAFDENSCRRTKSGRCWFRMQVKP